MEKFYFIYFAAMLFCRMLSNAYAYNRAFE